MKFIIWATSFLFALVNAAWVDDGSGLTRSVENTVFVDEIPYSGDTKVNAQFTDGVDSGTHYWEVSVAAAKMSIGLTSVHSFAEKYKIKGYFYNGNLSDGGSGLRINFGPALLPGDRVGMLVEFNETMKIWFYVNDEPLGLAFDVPISPTPLHPTISFKTGGSAATITRQGIPDVRTPKDLPTGVEGKWLGMYEGFGVSLGLEDTAIGYKGYCKLLNTVLFSMTRQDDDTFKTTLGPMTRMAGPPEMMEAEQGLLLFLEGVTGLTMDGNETLEVVGEMMNLIFTRDFSRHDPVNDLVISE